MEKQELYGIRDGQIICPQCRQMLVQADIESFRRCPYCNYLFPDDVRLEDYMLQPAVDLFVRAAGMEFFQISGKREFGREKFPL